MPKSIYGLTRHLTVKASKGPDAYDLTSNSLITPLSVPTPNTKPCICALTVNKYVQSQHAAVYANLLSAAWHDTNTWDSRICRKRIIFMLQVCPLYEGLADSLWCTLLCCMTHMPTLSMIRSTDQELARLALTGSNSYRQGILADQKLHRAVARALPAALGTC